jgi:uncharacterized 2Fe-2S/4Fe-4S cluster protein (DUF4445 family)
LLEALAAAGLSPARLSLPALRGLPLVLREAAGRLWAVVRTELTGTVTVLALSADRPVVCGLAVDIGTTSVSTLLADLETGEPLAAGSVANAQIRYGADVINRIIESTRPDGLSGLRSALINECLTPLICDICAACGVEAAQIYRVAAAGNTVMTHLLAGVWAGYIRLEPYVPAFFQLGELRGAETGLPVAADAEVTTAPCIGSYVGGDITAGVFAALLGRPRGCSLFIDLGTNGEIVLGGPDFLLACACSAGPAFEGGEIGCGMRAANGAIEAVSLDPVSLTPALTVIGPAGTRPAGICGSGLIDLVAALFAAGAINAKGRFAREDDRIRRDAAGLGSYVLAWGPETEDGRDLEISEADMDNFIRAKGAVFAAVRCLLAAADCAVTDLQAVYIAGGIGGGINIAGAVSVGMLPDLPPAIFSYLGNTSLLGAYAMLISDRAERDVRELSGGMTYLELSAHPGYMDEFVAACFLPHTDGSLFGVL